MPGPDQGNSKYSTPNFRLGASSGSRQFPPSLAPTLPPNPAPMSEQPQSSPPEACRKIPTAALELSARGATNLCLGETALAKGKPAEAITYLDAALKLFNANPIAKFICLARKAHCLSQTDRQGIGRRLAFGALKAIGRHPKLQPALREYELAAQEIADVEDGRGCPELLSELSRVSLEFADLALSRKRTTLGHRVIQASSKLVASLFGDQSSEYARFLSDAATVLLWHDCNKGGIELAERATLIWDRLVAETADLTARELGYMANCWGVYAEALIATKNPEMLGFAKCYATELEKLADEVPDPSRISGLAAELLGIIAWREGQMSLAIQKLDQARRLCTDSESVDEQVRIQRTCKHAEILAAAGDIEDGVDQMCIGLGLARQHLGNQHPSTMQIADKLICLCLSSPDCSQLGWALNQKLSIARDAFGDQSPSYLGQFVEVIKALLAADELESSLFYFDRLRDRARQLTIKDAKLSASVYEVGAAIHFALSKTADAIHLQEQAIRELENFQPQCFNQLIAATIQHSIYLSGLQPESAVFVLGNAEKTLNENRLGLSLHMARVKHRQGKLLGNDSAHHRQALKKLLSARKIYEQLGKDDSIEYAQVLVDTALLRHEYLASSFALSKTKLDPIWATLARAEDIFTMNGEPDSLTKATRYRKMSEIAAQLDRSEEGQHLKRRHAQIMRHVEIHPRSD